jgi:hypothetical protein
MKAKIILPSSDRFRRLPYLACNLSLVVTNLKAWNHNLLVDYTMHILGPVGPHLSRPIRTYKHIRQVFFERNYKASISSL